MTNIVAKPFVRWAGGKRQLLPELLKRVPGFDGDYFEPFVGGGALFFALKSIEGQPLFYSRLNDKLPALMNTYEALKKDPAEVYGWLKELEVQILNCCDFNDTPSEETSELVRKIYNKERTYLNTHIGDGTKKLYNGARLAACFIFLNKMGYNGLYRENKKGELNTPWDNTKLKFKVPPLEFYTAISNVLYESTTLYCQEFDVPGYYSEIEDIPKDSFFYFDPPYVPVSKTSNFATYTGGGFGWAEHVRLHDYARKLVDNGMKVMLSNSDCPEVRDLYKDFNLHEVVASRSINSVSTKRGKVSELILTGY